MNNSITFFDPEPFDLIYILKVDSRNTINLKHLSHATTNEHENKRSVVLYFGSTKQTFEGTAADRVIERLGILCDREFMAAYRKEIMKQILKGGQKKRGPKPTERVQRKVRLLMKNPTASVADIMTDEFIDGQFLFFKNEGFSEKMAREMARAEGKDFRVEEMNRLRANASDYGLNKSKGKSRKKRKVSAQKRKVSAQTIRR